MGNTLKIGFYTFIFLCFGLSFGVNVANAQNVNIPDSVLRSRIEYQLNKSPGAPITETDMATLTSISSDHQHDIRELTGLEYAINLKSLTLLRSPPRTQAELSARPFWRKADLAPLSKLTKLEKLTLQGVVVFDMSPVANLTNLRDLAFLYTYGISEIPDLSKLTALVHLRLGTNRITDISGVRGLTNLRQLRLESNRNLSDISPLTNLRNLEVLRLDNTLVPHASLSAVLPFMSTEIDQTVIDEYPPTSITSGEFGISGTNISDLSVLDSLPNVFLYGLYLRFMGTISSGTVYFHLTDLTPLVDLMNKGKVINSRTSIFSRLNLGLDYPSLYEDLPLLIAGSRYVEYESPNPMLEREFPEAASYRGHPRTRYTFKVRAVNEHSVLSEAWFVVTPRLMRDGDDNRQFANVPVTWTVTAPDGTQTQTQTLTGDDGLAEVTLTLGAHDETHTVEAVVPAKTTSVVDLQHDELRVAFTVTADRTVPPPRIARQTSFIPPSGGGGRALSALSFPGEISFSEVMFARDTDTGPLPQWIELYNASKTETVNLYRWRLEIKGRDTEGEPWHETITFKELPIPPGEMALLVTGEAPNTVDLPEARIYNLFEHHLNELRQHARIHGQKLIGQEGFSLELSDPYGAVSDITGNLDGDALTADVPAWALPPGSTEAGVRTSLFRLYDTVEEMPLDGRLSANWVSAAEVWVWLRTYWGTATDKGNPGHKGGWSFPRGSHLSFSELMLTSKGGLHSLPQWIELYNASETDIDLHGWTLKIEARDADGDHRYGVFRLQRFIVPSQQPVLIASGVGRGSLPRPYVYILDVQRAEDLSRPSPENRHAVLGQVDFLLTSEGFARTGHQHRNKMLGQVGFFLKLSDAEGTVIDIAGNLDGNPATADRPKWELPEGRLPDGERTSLTRRYYRGAGLPLDGKLRENWDRTADLPLKVTTYYGRSADIGTPGHTGEDGRPPGRVSFSELMLTSKGGLHSLPQWIELYNASETEIDLRGWTLRIEARDAAGDHRSGALTLKRFVIPPKQTGLIVTWHGRVSREISREHVYTLYSYKAFARNKVLGQRGFFLDLSDPEGAVSDTVGNLDGDKTTRDEPAWELPAGKTAEGARTSLLRRYHEIGMPLDGSTSTSWERAADLPLEVRTYWGRETDIGSPGWPNDKRVPPGQQISFSEVMIPSRVGRFHSLPQWIELYNASEIETVNLRGWRLEIEGRDTEGDHQHAVITFDDLDVPPNETVLLVTSKARRATDIPSERIYHLRLPPAFARNKVLGQRGFFLKLSDPTGIVSDTAGNLDGDKTTRDEPVWELPSDETEDGPRVSLMRRYYHVTGIPLDGRSAANWVPVSRLRLTVKTYYGSETDIGNPGYRGGGPLPVALSSFRADRTATGSVVLKWTTASERENAGFHILRGQTRNGRFVKITPKLIAGAGTTSQRSTYTWIDTTAQPNVVYYYRLEDVSFSAERQELATVRLRGDVSAEGKLLTTWSHLKRQN